MALSRSFNRYRGSEMALAAFGFTYIAVLVLGLIGWVINIVKIIGAANDPLTGWFIARVIGVIVAPVGAILGFF